MNIKIVMLPVAVLAVYAGGTNVLFAASETLPLYTEGALVPSERTRLARELPSRLAAARTHLTAIEAEAKTLFAASTETMQAIRVAKRLEMAGRLIDFATRECARGDVSGLASAERAFYDLAAFERYFQDEFSLWKVYPTSQAKTFDLVRDFGGVGDGRTSVNAAWRRAQQAIRALKGRPTILRIPRGEYLFTEKEIVPAFTCCYSGEKCRDTNVRHAQVPVFELENCIIEGADGANVRFVLGVFASQGLRLVNCRNVTVRNVEIAYAKEPFLQGAILAVDPKAASCDVRIDAGSLTPNDAAFTEKGASNGMLCGSSFTPAGDLVREASFMFYARRFTHLDKCVYRLFFDDTQTYYQHGKLKVGNVFVLPARNNYYHAASMAYCDFCNLENVRVRNARSAAFSVHRGRQSTFDRCRVCPLEGRMLSACADGLINSSGTALLRSEIRNQSDDGFNSMSRGVFINGVAGRDALLHPRFARDCSNEMMVAVDPVTGRYRGNLFASAAGQNVPWRGKGSWQTPFTRDVPNDLRTYDSLGLGEISHEQQGRAAMNLERLKAEPDHLYAPTADGIGSLVVGCAIRNMRGTGIVMQCPNALIEDNLFSNIWCAVRLGGLIKYHEGPPPYNTVVRNNRAFNVDSGFTTHFQVQNGGAAQCAPVRGCLFVSNYVEGATFEAYGFRNLGFSSLRGNRAARCRKCVRFHAVEGLEGEGNDFDLPDYDWSRHDIRMGAEGLWRLRFKNRKVLTAARCGVRPTVSVLTNGVLSVWRTPEALVSVLRKDETDYTDWVLEVTPHASEIIEADLPARLRFVPKEGLRLVMPQPCQYGPGVAFNAKFFAPERHYTYARGMLMMDYAHLALTNAEPFALFSVQPRPRNVGWKRTDVCFLRGEPTCGGDAEGGWLNHQHYPRVRTGETRRFPPLRVLRGVDNKAAIERYAVANGIVRTLSDKVKPEVLEKLKTGPLLFFRGAHAADMLAIVPLLPKPTLVHIASFLHGGWDREYPDILPPNEKLFGTSEQFRALIDAIHAHGCLFMPYTNPTWWGDTQPPSASFKRFGTSPASVRQDGQIAHEQYGVGTSGFRVSQWHSAVRAANERTLEAFCRDYPSDMLFQDQCGNRGNADDSNVAAPSPDAYVEGMLRMLEEESDRIPLGTEDCWDRVADFETGIFGACWRMVTTSGDGAFHAKKFRDNYAPETWELDPCALYLLHHRNLFWMHDLGQFVENRRTLAWMMALGYNLSYGLRPSTFAHDALARKWCCELADLQRTVVSRFAGKRLLDYRHVQGEGTVREDDGAVVAHYEGDIVVRVNLGDKPRLVGGERLSAYGWSVYGGGVAAVAPESRSIPPTTLGKGDFALLHMKPALSLRGTANQPSRWSGFLRDLAARKGCGFRELTTPAELAAALARNDVAVILNPYGETFPGTGEETLQAIKAFVERGGFWFETAAYPFYHLALLKNGKWQLTRLEETGAQSLGMSVAIAPDEGPEKLVFANHPEREDAKAVVNRETLDLPTDTITPLVRDIRGRIWFGYYTRGKGRLYRVGGSNPPFDLLAACISDAL